MGLYEVSLTMSLLGFGMGISDLPHVWYYVIFTLFYCLLDLSCSECDVMSLYFFVLLISGED